MRKAILISTFAILTNIATIRAQNVNIPDSVFKAALVANAGINTNGDAEIQVSEATTYTGAINVSSMGISDLTGIEAFTALIHLNCDNNQLTSLNVSSNTALVNINCRSNQLVILNDSGCTALVELDCSYNQLTSLNVSGNTALVNLYCFNNQLTSLNISSNTALVNLYCFNNQLTSLNVIGSTALTFLF